jgi:hypothetical protein
MRPKYKHIAIPGWMLTQPCAEPLSVLQPMLTHTSPDITTDQQTLVNILLDIDKKFIFSRNFKINKNEIALTISCMIIDFANSAQSRAELRVAILAAIAFINDLEGYTDQPKYFESAIQ